MNRDKKIIKEGRVLLHSSQQNTTNPFHYHLLDTHRQSIVLRKVTNNGIAYKESLGKSSL